MVSVIVTKYLRHLLYTERRRKVISSISAVKKKRNSLRLWTWEASSFTAYIVGSEVENVESVVFPDGCNQGHSTE